VLSRLVGTATAGKSWAGPERRERVTKDELFERYPVWRCVEEQLLKKLADTGRRNSRGPLPTRDPAPTLVVGARRSWRSRSNCLKTWRVPAGNARRGVSAARAIVAGSGARPVPQSGGRGLSPSLINRSISAQALDERLDRRVNCEQPVTPRARPRARGETITDPPRPANPLLCRDLAEGRQT